MDDGGMTLLGALRPSIPMRAIMALMKGDAYREQLSRATGTPTGYLKQYLAALINGGLVVRYPQGKKITMYALTPRGRHVGLTLLMLNQIPELDDERQAREIEKRYHDLLTYMSRVSSGELLDRAVAETLGGDLSFAARLNALVRSIVPGRVFTIDELRKDHNMLFPMDRRDKEAFSTPLCRFRDKKKKEYIPGLRLIRNGTYLMEMEGEARAKRETPSDGAERPEEALLAGVVGASAPLAGVTQE